MAEPQIWTLPEEPPVGTVVGPIEQPSPARWSRPATPLQEHDPYWTVLIAGDGNEPDRNGLVFRWVDLVAIGVREYSDPSDPDGYQQELDRLRAEVESLRADLLATAQNLTQAERDRDVNGEALSRAQRERGEAQREAAALKNVVRSLAQVANQAVTS